jgi:hypothetical protein
MTDRELLELAAKAAGYKLHRSQSAMDGVLLDDQTYWSPLTDDGDALRLAVILGLVVDCSRPSAGEPYKQHAIWLNELCDNATLTRRAIVRAAAEIGKAMP